MLQRGELFGIFPEGTRSRDGTLHKGRTGAARLALEVGCPIYPVGIVGTDRDPAARRQVPKLFRSCSITIGRPIRPERYHAAMASRTCVPRSMTDEVMFEIRELTGQDYRDRYAGADDPRPNRIVPTGRHVRPRRPSVSRASATPGVSRTTPNRGEPRRRRGRVRRLSRR